MTITEFNRELAQFQRRLSWRFFFAIAPLFIAFGIAGIVRSYNPELADIAAPIIVFAIGVPIMLLGFVYADRTYKKHPALMCPYCDRTLSRAKSIVVATGNCPNCGRRVLTDDTIGT